MSFVTRTAIPRRTVLRGIGATLGLPLLDAMVPALTPLVKTAANPVRRFGVFYVPNGMSILPGAWTPATEGSLGELPRILAPLTPFRDQLLVLSGLTLKPANPLPGEGAGDHSRGPSGYLTGVHIKKTEGSDIRAGVSIDQMMAQELGKDTQLGSLEIGMDSVDFVGACDPGYSCAYEATIAWRTPTTPLPMENDPRAVFDRLFGADTTDRRARLAQIAKDRSLLDTLTHHVARLQKELGASDRAKLTQYLEAVREAERRLQKAEEQSARDLPFVERPNGGIPATFEEHFTLMFDLVALAYQADLTRVFTFMLAKEMGPHAYPESGVPESHHSQSHHQGQEEKLQKLSRINAYHVKMFSYFVEKLHATQDGDGSLLDHAIINYGASISNSDQHRHNNLPIVLIGGGAGRLKGGRHIRYPEDTPLMNLHRALLDKMEIRVDELGDSTGKLEGLS